MSGKYHYLSLAILISLAAWLVNSQATMSPVWYGPYLSGAANLSWSGEFYIDSEEVFYFDELTTEQQHSYQFGRSGSTVYYEANPVGYVYIVWLATQLFSALSDIHALELFQLLAHIGLSFVVIALLRTRLHKCMFALVYALNPVVLYYVVYPYYYFWQALPSLLFAVALLAGSHWGTISRFEQRAVMLCIAILLPLCGLVVSARATTIAVFVLSLVLLFWFLRGYRVLLTVGLLAAVAVFSFANKPMAKNFYHTVYVGVGAYPNPYMDKLSDHEGYDLFEREYGYVLDGSIGGNYYEPENIAKYKAITRDESVRIIQQHPLMMFRNVLLNYLQSFTIGYLTEQPVAVYYGMAAAGVFVVALLLYFKQYLIFIGASAASSTFVLYYPPIPAYMYGSYLILSLGLVIILARLIDKRFPNAGKWLDSIGS